ncbi:MAG: TIM-barrel domain-containing protein [Saprospiraceae bacterium]
MKYLFLLLTVIVFGFQSTFGQNVSGFECEQVNQDIHRFTYLSKNPRMVYQVSDAVVLKGFGPCEDCVIEKDAVQIPILDVTILARPNGDGFVITLKDDEQIYGGGGRALPMNRRGYAFPLNNNPWYGYGLGADHLNFSVPFFISSRGYGIFFNNPSKGFIDIGKTNPNIIDVQFTGGRLDVYIIKGNSVAEVLKKYHELTGRQEMVPKWAMGLFMSRFGYTSEKQVMSIAKEMDKKKFPFDAVIFDLFWFGDSIKSSMGNLDWVNTRAWPNPQKMIHNLSKKGRKTILITEPFFLENTKHYKAVSPFLAKDSVGQPYALKHFYFGKGGLIDIFREDAQSWFLTKYDEQIKIGVAGWWGDLGEPESHPSDMVHDLSLLGGSDNTSANAVHNLYGHIWTKMLYEHYITLNPNYKLFNLNRAGFAGSQRYGIIPWTGDVGRSWDGLKAQIPLLAGMSLSGIPYIHSDAGGFAGGDKDPELYMRWFQFASFTPILRPHGTAVYEIDPAAVSYPSEPALIKGQWEETIRKYTLLRYEMMPYNYNLAYRHFKYGEPLIAPLLFNFEKDLIAQNINDQYCWGKDIIVAPVVEKGIKRRLLYLPVSHQWYPLQSNFLNQPIQQVSGWQAWDVSEGKLPVFVKEGSFIVMNSRKDGNNSRDFDNGNIEVHYYASEQNSTAKWYDDEGNDRLAYQEGRYDLLKFSAEIQNQKTQIIIYSVKSGDKGWRLKRKVKLYLHGFENIKSVYWNGKLMHLKKDGSILFNYKSTENYTIEVNGAEN